MPKPLVAGKRKRGHVQRYLKSLESQIQEGTKTTLLMRGHKTSQRVNDVLADLHLQVRHMSRRSLACSLV